jgi:hypothetical protein
MPRWIGIFLSVLILLGTACSRRVEPPDFPKSVSPGWRLNGVNHSQQPDWTAHYTGPSSAHVQVGSARVRVWAIKSFEEGLARTQTWRTQPDTVVFSSDRYFAAVDWSGVDRAEAGALVRAIEKAIGITPQPR